MSLNFTEKKSANTSTELRVIAELKQMSTLEGVRWVWPDIRQIKVGNGMFVGHIYDLVDGHNNTYELWHKSHVTEIRDRHVLTISESN